MVQPVANHKLFLTYERSSDGPQLFTSATRLKLKSDSLRSNFRFSPVDHLVSPPLLSLPTSSLRGSEFERLSNRSTAFFYTFHAIRLVFSRHASAPCAYASCIAQTRDNMGLSETWGSIHDVTVQHVPEQHLISGLGPREEYHFRRVQAA